MESMTAGEIAAIITAALLAMAGAIVTIGNAIEKLVKVWRAAKAPNNRQDERLDALEQHVEEIDSYLAQDKHRLDTLDDGNRVTQRALLALLAHGIDGNNVEQMEKAKAALEEHLINR